MRGRNKLAELYGDRCPCCGVIMLEGDERPPAPEEQGRRRTRAHIFPKGHPSRNEHDWFHACERCNNDQGSLALDEWWLILAHRGDERHNNLRVLLEQLSGRGGLCGGSIRSIFARIEARAQALGQ